MGQAAYKNTPDSIEATAGAALSAGDVVVLAATPALVGVVAGLQDIANGDQYTAQIAGIFEVTKKTVDAPALGALVYWDDAANEATVTAGGNTEMGVAYKAYVNGDTKMKVILNHGA